jgi:hypothetical protein
MRRRACAGGAAGSISGSFLKKPKNFCPFASWVATTQTGKVFFDSFFFRKKKTLSYFGWFTSRR